VLCAYELRIRNDRKKDKQVTEHDGNIRYLTLHGLPYTECMQASLLPRPDITDLLGIGYRRIPVMGLGRSVICDSRFVQTPHNAYLRLFEQNSD